MTGREFVDEYADQNLDVPLLVMDGYDEAILGIMHVFGQPPSVAYDRRKVIEMLQSQGMSWEDAVEFHEFNQAGAYIEGVCCFIDMPEPDVSMGHDG